jgi:hypothetical protein
MSALASRAEKNWLEANDFPSVLSDRRGEKPFERKLDAFCAVLEQEWATGVHGYFSFGLLEKSSVFRVAMATDGPVPRPASLVMTYHVSLEEAFNFMDDKGPIRSTTRKWCHRVYALQDMMPEGDGRQVPTQYLRAEPKIRELIRSKAPVVMLDVIAALAPKDCAAEHGLSEIVKAELTALLRQAHADGKAVVFMLGGNRPRTLAQKVYLKSPFTDYGLRCGYLRWRDGAGEPWASEKSMGNGRVIIGLQLPPEA